MFAEDLSCANILAYQIEIPSVLTAGKLFVRHMYNLASGCCGPCYLAGEAGHLSSVQSRASLTNYNIPQILDRQRRENKAMKWRVRGGKRCLFNENGIVQKKRPK
jgi:hypothetical protein